MLRCQIRWAWANQGKKSYFFIFCLMPSPFPCLKFAGLTESSLQTGHIPQPAFEIFHNHFSPAEAPEHQINRRSLDQPHVFGVWSADLNVQWNHSPYLIPGLSHRENIPQISSLRVYLNWLSPFAVKAKKGEIEEAMRADIKNKKGLTSNCELVVQRMHYPRSVV